MLICLNYSCVRVLGDVTKRPLILRILNLNATTTNNKDCYCVCWYLRVARWGASPVFTPAWHWPLWLECRAAQEAITNIFIVMILCQLNTNTQPWNGASVAVASIAYFIANPDTKEVSQLKMPAVARVDISQDKVGTNVKSKYWHCLAAQFAAGWVVLEIVRAGGGVTYHRQTILAWRVYELFDKFQGNWVLCLNIVTLKLTLQWKQITQQWWN